MNDALSASRSQQWVIVPAHAPAQLPLVRELFMEYAQSLAIDLCFQDFDRELAELPGAYAPPQGRLLLAMAATTLVGCVALRNLGDGTCEMKRLYVRPAFRGKGAGARLAKVSIAEARRQGYRRMRLDTLPSMETALGLYHSLGFQPIAAYYDNPYPGTVFLELSLK